MRHYRRMKPVTDTSAADWLVTAMHPFAQDVGSVIPPVFEAYARVFHPAFRGGHDDDGTPVKWAEIAEANGKTAHVGMQFEFLVPEECFDRARNQKSAQPGLWN